MGLIDGPGRTANMTRALHKSNISHADCGASPSTARATPMRAPCRRAIVPTGIRRPMRNLFAAAKLLLLDLASTFFFLVLYLLTKNIPLSVALGVALGIAQIGWGLVRKK